MLMLLVQEPYFKNHWPYTYTISKSSSKSYSLGEDEIERWCFTFLFYSQQTVDSSILQPSYSSDPESAHHVYLPTLVLCNLLKGKPRSYSCFPVSQYLEQCLLLPDTNVLQLIFRMIQGSSVMHSSKSKPLVGN